MTGLKEHLNSTFPFGQAATENEKLLDLHENLLVLATRRQFFFEPCLEIKTASFNCTTEVHTTLEYCR